MEPSLLKWPSEYCFNSDVRYNNSREGPVCRHERIFAVVFLMLIKDAGQKAIHKCTTLRHAQSAVAADLNAITILEAEAGGHPGRDMVGSMVHGGVVPNAVDVPMVLAWELDFVANSSRLWPWALMAYCWVLG